MSLSVYIYGDSIIHRISFISKFIFLLLFSSILFFISKLEVSIAGLFVIFLLLKISKIQFSIFIKQLKPIVPFFFILFIVQMYLFDYNEALNVVIRFIVLILLAILVTLTTKSSDIIYSIENRLYFLKYIKVDPTKVGLAISLTLRFIPVLAIITNEVKEAQKVRGLETNIIAIAIPTIIRTLKMADDISDAIEARSFNSRH